MENGNVYNFAAGPAMLPKDVLLQIQDDIRHYKQTNMSILELGHRSETFEAILQKVKSEMRQLLNIPKNYDILFTQGGASLQFSMIPMNLMHHQQADYILTGLFSELAYQEAKRYGNVNIAGSSKECAYCKIPDEDTLHFSKDSDYVYLCWNNTVYGSMWHDVPNVNGKAIVADMTSCLFTQQMDVEKFGLLFAGTQKNLGIAGLCVVIMREDLIKKPTICTPMSMRYDTLKNTNSMYQTPPIFAIYVLEKMLTWIKHQGGVKELEKRNIEKSSLLYACLDNSSFYQTKIVPKDRSFVNVTFFTPSSYLDAVFVQEAKQCGLLQLQGHRHVKGIRVSLYNAMPIEGVQALLAFMLDFEYRYKSYV